MDAVKYIKEKGRMCGSFTLCQGCEIDYMLKTMPGSCIDFFRENPEKAVSIVEKWSAEHPPKTRQSEFLKMYPNAKIENDVLLICPNFVDVKCGSICRDTKCGVSCRVSCNTCCKNYWLAEVE